MAGWLLAADGVCFKLAGWQRTVRVLPYCGSHVAWPCVCESGFISVACDWLLLLLLVAAGARWCAGRTQ